MAVFAGQVTGDILVKKELSIYLSGVVETLPDHAVHDDPGQQQETEEVGLDLSHFIDPLTSMEDFIPVR